MKRITCVTPNIAGGGAERVLQILISLWSDKGYAVHVVGRGHFPLDCAAAQRLDKRVNLEWINSAEVATKWPPKMKTIGVLLSLRRSIQRSRPDVVVAFTDGIAVDCLLALMGTIIPVVVSEHCDPNVQHFEMAPTVARESASRSLINQIRGYLRMWLYKQASAVVCLTDTALSFFPAEVRRQGWVIPNPVLTPLCSSHTSPEMNDYHDKRRVISIGRLSKEKGLDRLIQAFSSIAYNHPHWILEFWGTGSEEQKLKNLAQSLGVLHQVRFAGWTDDVYSVLKGADIFAMSSHREGFPMALCEAMASGVPVVSFDCPSGPRHIIRNGIDGVLIPNGDIVSLAKSLNWLMGNERERLALGIRAKEITTRFSTAEVLRCWDQLFSAIITNQPK